MFKRILFVAVVCLGLGTGAVQHAQQPPKKVDFATEVRPIFRQYCVDCHGSKEQKSSLRLDRRKDAMRGGTIPVIGPGNADGSRLYHKLIGDRFGPQMPPTGALPAAHVATIKRWIDEGADWPDAVSGDVPPAPPDPDTTALISATLNGDVAAVRQILARGVNPNLSNASGVTPLMLAVTDIEKVRLLLERGADVNARSDDGRTPLLIAAGIPGAVEVSRLLLDRGAKITARAPGLIGETTPLMQSLYSGDEATFKLLVERGANVADGGFGALGLAMRAQCAGCIETILKAIDKSQISPAMLLASPPFGPALATPVLLELGADVQARDADGRTALMLAAASDAVPVDSVSALLKRGADVNATTPAGETALTFAKLRGDTAVTQLLVKAGGIDGKPRPTHTPTYAPAATPRAAVARVLPLLQRTDVAFMKKSGCVSCHHNSVAAMTVSLARARGLAVDESIARSQVKAIGAYVDNWSDRAWQGIGIPGDADTVSYILVGLAAEKHVPDAATDAMAYFLKTSQVSDGSWRLLAHRPPIESDEVQVTAMSMRALQLYAPASQRAAYRPTVDRAGAWLAKAAPRSAEGRAFHLLGLHWSNAGSASMQKAAKAILAEQRADGGWSQMPTLASDAYATGQALVALLQAGTTTASDPAVRRGVQFLLRTQLADGSWYVPSRSLPIQPHFESGFPHGKDQFISAAASNWAAMALTYAVNRGS